MRFETRSEKDARKFRRSDFYRLVRKYEAEAKRNPARYRARVMAIALLGYGMIVGFMLLVVGLLALVIFRNVTAGFEGWMIGSYAILGVLIWTILRGILLPFPFPFAFELDLGAFPMLQRTVRDVKKKLGVWRTPRILVTDEYNAFALSRPWLGIAGPARHYVALGLPLLHALNVEELSAVIAHEMAHLSRFHSRWMAWIQRLRVTWFELLHRLGRSWVGRFLLLPFARWWWGYFEAATVVLSRQQELEANQVAARAVGRDLVVQALVRTEVMGRRVVADYWEELWQRSAREAHVPASVVTMLGRSLTRQPTAEIVSETLNRAFGDHTEIGSTHPCLRDTLTSLDYLTGKEQSDRARVLSRLSGRSREVAAHELMPQGLDQASQIFDALWRDFLTPIWEVRNRQGLQFREMMLELDELWKAEGKLPAVKLWRRAWLTREFYGEEKAMPLVKQVLAIDGKHPLANFQLGRFLLERDDATGADHVFNAIEVDPALQGEGHRLLADHYRREGLTEAAEGLEFAAMDAEDALDDANEERLERIRARDEFLPHELSEEVVDDLRDLLSGIDDVKRVYLVRKKTEHLPELPFYVIGIVPHIGRFARKRAERLRALEFDCDVRIDFASSHRLVILGRGTWWLRRSLHRVPGSEIWNSRRAS